MPPRTPAESAPMTDYEIRITRRDGQSLIIDSRSMGDHAAIRRAHTLAMPSDAIEVWRGMTCVFEAGAHALAD